MTERRRSVLTQTFRELANLSLAALGLGQFVGQQRWSWEFILAGIALWAGFVGVALLFATDGGDA